MGRLLTYITLVLCIATAAAQVRPQTRGSKPVKAKEKPAPQTTDLSLGLAFNKSVLFLARNTKDHNDALGFTFNATYGGNRPYRLCVEYTSYRRIDIAPTWYNIKASTLEINGQAIYRSKGKIGFYLLTGLSYNVFRGLFTGVADYQNLRALYPSNQEVLTRWVGVNAGVGFEYSIKRVILFGSYKMRIGRSSDNKAINIQDVCYSFGLRYKFKAPSIDRLFKGPRNRYFLR